MYNEIVSEAVEQVQDMPHWTPEQKHTVAFQIARADLNAKEIEYDAGELDKDIAELEASLSEPAPGQQLALPFETGEPLDLPFM